MENLVFDTKYVVQTVLRKFPRKELHPGKRNMYRICMSVFDDTLDMAYFYVPSKDVEFKDDMSCTVLLTQDTYDVYYCSKSEEIDVVRDSVHRFVLTDAYYHVYSERKCALFDMFCVSKRAIYELDDSFVVTFLSSEIAQDTFIRFSVPKKRLYWVQDCGMEYAHIDLGQNFYGVTFKNKATHWREHTEDVFSDVIALDFLNSKRAACASVSPKLYAAFLEQEYVYSKLFSL